LCYHYRREYIRGLFGSVGALANLALQVSPLSVRKTESRTPGSLQASDLGQAVVATDARCALVSFVTTPIVVGRENVYILFVTDSALATAAQSYEWTFTENGGAPNVQTTQLGEVSYQPQSTGTLDLKVRVLDSGSSEQASLSLTQDITSLNPILEGVIANAGDQPGPGVGNPEVVRELVNDYSVYYQGVTLKTPEAGDFFLNFLFSMVFDGAHQRTPDQRKQHTDDLAQVLNDETGDFASLITEGTGVCGVRLPLLAMTDGVAGAGSAASLPWTELPDVPAQHDSAEQQLCQAVAALDEGARIDLFNIARFPKSNITACGRIVEALRDRYFAGTDFSDVLAGMSGTRAQWIVRHYREGPLSRS
jgi:hypothetical protein